MPLTPEQIEKSRAEFSSYIKHIIPNSYSTVWSDANNCFLSPSVQVMYEVWLARQESLCVELPGGYDRYRLQEMEEKSFCEASEYNQALEDCQEALTEAGVNWK